MGMTFGSDGTLFRGAQTETALYAHKTPQTTNAQGTPMAGEVVHKSYVSIDWVDTFAWDDDALTLIFTTNRLAQWFYSPAAPSKDMKGNMMFNGMNGANFRVWRQQVGTKSYLAGMQKSKGMD